MRARRGGLVHKAIIHVIFIGLVFGLFYAVISSRVSSRDVKQQVLEKQIALLIDSAEPGMSFVVERKNVNGYIEKIEIKEGRVFVYIDGIKISKGYPYFSRHDVVVEQDENKLYVRVADEV